MAIGERDNYFYELQMSFTADLPKVLSRKVNALNNQPTLEQLILGLIGGRPLSVYVPFCGDLKDSHHILDIAGRWDARTLYLIDINPELSIPDQWQGVPVNFHLGDVNEMMPRLPQPTEGGVGLVYQAGLEPYPQFIDALDSPRSSVYKYYQALWQNYVRVADIVLVGPPHQCIDGIIDEAGFERVALSPLYYDQIDRQVVPRWTHQLFIKSER